MTSVVERLLDGPTQVGVRFIYGKVTFNYCFKTSKIVVKVTI